MKEALGKWKRRWVSGGDAGLVLLGGAQPVIPSNL